MIITSYLLLILHHFYDQNGMILQNKIPAITAYLKGDKFNRNVSIVQVFSPSEAKAPFL